ncbi:MAG: hypothetical protein Q9187_005523 [Circinaria calcarea]
MADQTDLLLPSSQLSLQELCEKKYLSQILDSSFTASDFAALEPRLQEILFSKLRTETTRLREIEKKWCRLTRSCPRVDTKIHLDHNRIEYGDPDDEEDDCILREGFLAKWSYLGEDNNESQAGADAAWYAGRAEANEDHLSRGTKNHPNIHWHHSDLICEPSESGLGLYVHRPSTPRSFYSKWSNSFWFRISSQLLLYRLTVTFGMPPPKETDGYKSCWEIELVHCDGASVLEFGEHKGAASARFRGTTDASDDALKLLNFLVGINCPHTYDGIVAGTIA